MRTYPGWLIWSARSGYAIGSIIKPVISEPGTLDLLDACATAVAIGEIADDSGLDAEDLCKLVLRGWVGRLELSQPTV